MIDTVKLTLQDWRVNTGASLKVNAGNVDFKTGEILQTHLFTDSSGHEVNGSYAHYVGEKLNLSIRPIAGQVYAFATFSAPKRMSEDNYNPIKESQLPEVFESVENELNENGIDTDINKARLSRLDTFKNILTDENTLSYSRLFELLEANRAKDKSTHGATTWLMKNRSTEYCIYDKLEEMRSSGHSTTGLEKTLRFEHRCKSASKVKSFLKNVTTVEDLKSYGWRALEERNIKAWTDNFFKYSFEDFEILVMSVMKRELEVFRKMFGRNYFSRYLKACGAYWLASSSGGVEVVKRTLEEMGEDRLKVYRAERELKENILLIQTMHNDSSTPMTIGELYSELKYKMERIEA
jgi:hypothetical protein